MQRSGQGVSDPDAKMEKIRRKAKGYYQKNRSRILAQKKFHQRRNVERIRKYRYPNREKLREYYSKYHADHKEKYAGYQKAYREKQRMERAEEEAERLRRIEREKIKMKGVNRNTVIELLEPLKGEERIEWIKTLFPQLDGSVNLEEWYQWYKTGPIKIKRSPEEERNHRMEFQRTYYILHREEILAKKREYERANKEKIRERRKAYYEKNKEMFSAKAKERYGRKKGMTFI